MRSVSRLRVGGTRPRASLRRSSTVSYPIQRSTPSRPFAADARACLLEQPRSDRPRPDAVKGAPELTSFVERRARSRDHHRLDERGTLDPSVPEERHGAHGRREHGRGGRGQRLLRRDSGRRRVRVSRRARSVRSRNHGFPHANNRALMTCNARYVLLLNPDTEVVDGTFEEMVRAMDERPTVGLAGGRQIDGRRLPRLDDSPFPERHPCPRRRPVRRAPARAARMARGARARTEPLRAGGRRAIGRLARSCSSGGRRSRAPASSTSASSCTPMSPICAGASRWPAGRSGIFRS